jgi:hypothetical protein
LVGSRETESSTSGNAEITGENNTDYIYVKGTIHHEFVPEKQNLNSKFHKEAIKKLSAKSLH